MVDNENSFIYKQVSFYKGGDGNSCLRFPYNRVFTGMDQFYRFEMTHVYQQSSITGGIKG